MTEPMKAVDGELLETDERRMLVESTPCGGCGRESTEPFSFLSVPALAFGRKGTVMGFCPPPGWAVVMVPDVDGLEGSTAFVCPECQDDPKLLLALTDSEGVS